MLALLMEHELGTDFFYSLSNSCICETSCRKIFLVFTIHKFRRYYKEKEQEQFFSSYNVYLL